ncbi:hypothetical protein M899_2647 [Bacteriovorax sp. BSW11_IV]|uniref:beta strand repeat-containing protein n=1 Tax=Bacteriovorax sp. BSW11_IV TaxID=1353529 RepID=UPI00038A2638|nr:hypothetical protein [Bacteriovorax sp. BSW11_IV]EQC48159.1 hypothetical protein M899_2647 [Bacteriovorax sp. BSW11_IV]
MTLKKRISDLRRRVLGVVKFLILLAPILVLPSCNENKILVDITPFEVSQSGGSEAPDPALPTAPLVVLKDRTSSDSDISNELTVDIEVTDLGSIDSWCISETQVTLPPDTSTCSSGAWTTTLPTDFTFTPGEGLREVYVWYADENGNIASTAVVATINLDTTSPTSAVTTLPSTIIDISNQESFTLSGTCSEEGGDVVISNSVNATTTCTGGVWNVDLDVSLLPNGTITFDIDLNDEAGNSASTQTINLTKNTVTPDPALALSDTDSSSTTYSNSLTVNAAITSDTYAKRWCLSELQTTKPSDVSTCASSAWVSTKPTSYTFTAGEGTRTLYTWVADIGGNISENSISDSITIDTTPSLIDFSTAANSSVLSSATLSGTCSEDGIISVSGDVVNKTTSCASGVWSDTFDFSAQAVGTITVSIDQTDVAGNISTTVQRDFSRVSLIYNLNADTVNSFDVAISYGIGDVTNLKTFTYKIAEGATPPSDCSAGIDFGNTNATQTISSLKASTQYGLTVCYVDTSDVELERVSLTFTTLAPISSGTGLVCSGGGDVNTTCYVNDVQNFASNSVIYVPGNLVMQSGGSLTSNNLEKIILKVDGNTTIESGGKIAANLSFLETTILDIQAGGEINVSALGYLGGISPALAGNGPSGGQGHSNSSADPGGAGHAGPGGNGRSSGGTTVYGDRKEPVDFGSGGGAGDDEVGGHGGGVVKIIVNDLIVNGNIFAKGGQGENSCCDQGAGGSGGSIWIQVNNSFTGSGAISVGGGSAGGVDGNEITGAGAAGRLAIYQNSGAYVYSGSIDINGGSSGTRGSSGTFYLELANINQLCDSGDFSSTCTISTAKTIGGDTSITSGNLVIDATGAIDIKGIDSTFVFNNPTGNFSINTGGSFSMDPKTSVSNLVANTLTVDGSWLANLTESSIATANISGTFNANGKGYLGGTGSLDGEGPSPGKGTANDGGGGAHATDGFAGDAGTAGSPSYGTATAPVTYGSAGGAGGTQIGGSGGGAIKLIVSGALSITGTLSANGLNGTVNSDISGGGAGGSLWIEAASLSGTGAITTNGGASGSSASNGNGSGGYIYLKVTDAYYYGTISSKAGRSVAEGSVVVDVTNAYIACSGGGSVLTTCYINDTQNLVPYFEYTVGGNLVVQNGGLLKGGVGELNKLTVSGNITVESGGSINANFSSLTGNAIDIQSGGSISAEGLGFLGGKNRSESGQGPSPGLASSASPAGGGAHGANGGNGSLAGGNAPYGSESAPVTFGSGGGACWDADGGNGGGAIKLIANSLTVNGTLSAKGIDITSTSAYVAGGGAGGSLWLQIANAFDGSGTVTVAGGYGRFQSGGLSGGGGGGRLAIEFNGSSFAFNGSLSVLGGRYSGRIGGDGTYYLSLGDSNSLCDSGDLTSTCVINSKKNLGHNLILNGNNITLTSTGLLDVSGTNTGFSLDLTGDLQLQSGSSIVHTEYLSDLEIKVDGNLTVENTASILSNISLLEVGTLTVDAGGKISASGMGYLGGLGGKAGEGPSPGLASGGNEGGGGGHASVGGDGNGATTAGGTVIYGDMLAPITYGSGGGAGYSLKGGNGGGAIKVIANDINLNGELSANGSDCAYTASYVAGAGAGGSLWLQVANSFTGSGSITAKGGNGHVVSVGSGGGSGGRVAVFFNGTNLGYGGEVSSLGGRGSSDWGGDGTYYLSLASINSICDAGDFSTTCTINKTKTLGGNLALTGNHLELTPTGGLTIMGSNSGSSLDFTGSLTMRGGSSINRYEYLSTYEMLFDGAVTLENASSINLNLSLLEASSLNLQAGSTINASALGYAGGVGGQDGKGTSPGNGASTKDAGGGAHARDGGDGQDSSTLGGTPSYGSETNPTDYGSGGGGSNKYNGGAGGGIVKIVAPSITIDGEILAEGGNGSGNSSYEGGGGAGGSIWLVSTTSLSGSGKLSVAGGNSYGTSSGAGSAGRISIELGSSPYNFYGSVGLLAGTGKIANSKGTLNISFNSEDQFCDIGDSSSSCELNTKKVLPALSFAGDLILNEGATLYDDTNTFSVAGDFTLKANKNLVSISNFKYNFNVTGTTTFEANSLVKMNLNNFQSGNMNLLGSIDVSEMGHSGLSGLGAGKNSSGGNNSGGGASYGSLGGRGYDSNTAGDLYGDETAPVEFGSTGGKESSVLGGAGGGAVKLSVTNTLNFTGSILSNGGNGVNVSTDHSSGGSGGSIWLVAGSIIGNGSLSAKGGNPAASWSACGGAGRIAINATNAAGNYQYGGVVDMKCIDRGVDEGSFYLTLADPNMICDSGDFSSTCTISSDRTLGGVQNFTGVGSFSLSPSTNLRVYGNSSAISFDLSGSFSSGVGSLIYSSKKISKIHTGTTINLAGAVEASLPDVYAVGDITVDGVISAFNKGGLPGHYAMAGIGLGGGLPCSGGNNPGGGGGHGGAGGDGYCASSGGASYGNILRPDTEGSGGASDTDTDTSGGAGGGVIKMISDGHIAINANINSNGQDGEVVGGSAGGGGAGGSVYLDGLSCDGTGNLSAIGGSSTGTLYAAGGGGGRIHLSCATNSWSGVADVTGGIADNAGRYGSSGTIDYTVIP